MQHPATVQTHMSVTRICRSKEGAQAAGLMPILAIGLKDTASRKKAAAVEAAQRAALHDADEAAAARIAELEAVHKNRLSQPLHISNPICVVIIQFLHR